MWFIRRATLLSAIALSSFIPVSGAPHKAPPPISIEQQSTFEMLSTKLDAINDTDTQPSIDISAQLEQSAPADVNKQVSAQQDEQCAEIRQLLLAARDRQHVVLAVDETATADNGVDLYEYPLVSNAVSAYWRHEKMASHQRLTNKVVASVSHTE